MERGRPGRSGIRMPECGRDGRAPCRPASGGFSGQRLMGLRRMKSVALRGARFGGFGGRLEVCTTRAGRGAGGRAAVFAGGGSVRDGDGDGAGAGDGGLAGETAVGLVVGGLSNPLAFIGIGR